MALTQEEVRHVALLARIALDDEQVATLQTELNGVFDYIDQISQLDLADVEPMVHSIPLVNSMREDVPVTGLDRERALANAPAREDDAILIPRIIGPGADA
ncbi:MAG: Asp-tRNA(Asn)/Glu-tRNA(Gln) amidotransferase subunit GatC [Coriobacteriia bacterium]|nr:Asp-tRNA(Asn)/Glu-tRNA(Gln) amidotransferase subunit GatC [Coriobacteriia bacterium]